MILRPASERTDLYREPTMCKEPVQPHIVQTLNLCRFCEVPNDVSCKIEQVEW